MTFLCVSGEEYMKHGSKSHTSVITEQIMKYYEIFKGGPFSIASKRLFDYNINRQFRTAEYRLAHEEGSM